ncbi:MAG: helix-turn-helix domain-containing protein, partial [Desulfocucumaceae bacterium]
IIQKYVLLIDDDNSCDEIISKLINEKVSKMSGLEVPEGNTITLKIGKLEDMEREIIDYLLSRGVGIKEASKILGTSRTTLWRKAKAADEIMFP